MGAGCPADEMWVKQHLQQQQQQQLMAFLFRHTPACLLHSTIQLLNSEAALCAGRRCSPQAEPTPSLWDPTTCSCAGRSPLLGLSM